MVKPTIVSVEVVFRKENLDKTFFSFRFKSISPVNHRDSILDKKKILVKTLTALSIRGRKKYRIENYCLGEHITIWVLCKDGSWNDKLI